jgi:hypothetical protein
VTGPTRRSAGRTLTELVVIFIGVSAAFFVENYREDRQELQELDEAVDAIVFELGHFSGRTVVHAEAIEDGIASWEVSTAEGVRPMPADYVIPGALRPPTPAWETTVASGTANRIEPTLLMDLGWFYNEFVGVHVNHQRQVAFSEREIQPRAELGADAFYGPDGHLLPEFRVHMRHQGVFAADLRRMARWADSLRTVLAETRGR